MRFQVDKSKVVHETIDDEVILIQLKTGVYYSLEGGAEIWQALVSGHDAREIAELLGDCYDASSETIEPTVSSLVEELRTEGLIDEAPTPAPPGDSNGGDVLGDRPPARKPYQTPVLHRYTDMADFLLVDPIHEVEHGAGWPN